MKTRGKVFNLMAAAVVGISALFAASASNAATILNVTGDVDANNGRVTTYDYDADFIRGTLSCSLGCEGLTLSTLSFTGASDTTGYPKYQDSTGFGNINAELFIHDTNGASSTANELIQINAVQGTTYTSGFKYELGGGDDGTDFTWTTNAEYILLKIGNFPDRTVIKNTGGYGNVFTFLQAPGGNGLSHFTSYGEYECPQGQHPDCGGGGVLPPVPLPAGMPLMLGALGLLAAVRRKTRKAA